MSSDNAIDSTGEFTRLSSEVGDLQSRLDRSGARVNWLSRFARVMTRGDGIDAIWRHMLVSASEHVPSSRGTLLCRSEAGAPLKVRGLIGHDEDPVISAMGARIDRFLHLLTEAAHLNMEVAPKLMRRIQAAAPRVRSVVIVPVLVRGDLEGAVILYRFVGDLDYTVEDSRLLSALGNLAALGLAQAYRETELIRRSLELESTVRQRTERLSVALTELRNANIQLEDRVHQRTAELNRANDSLKETQHYLLRADKMSSLARLASGIAHEINNPMAYVQGNLKILGEYAEELEAVFQRLESGAGKLAPEEVVSLLRRQLQDPEVVSIREDMGGLLSETREGASRVVELAKRIRTFAHLDTSAMESVDLSEMLDDAFRILARMSTGMEIVREYADVAPVDGFPLLVSQMFLNLIVNAVDACEGRGRITVRVLNDDEAAVVEIGDDGPGIPREAMTHIFEPFFTTKEVGKGTGLGLYTVYQIAERHGADLNIQSSPEQGTTFRIRFARDSSLDLVEGKTW